MNATTRAVLWALAATALYSLAAALAKFAAAHFHVLEILFVRQLAALASTLPTLARDFPASLATRRPGLHLLRIAGAFLALGGGIWAVAVLPLVVAVTLGFAQVFFVAILAALFLGESLGRGRMAAMVLGFAGVLLVMRPDAKGLLDVRAAIPLGAALGAAVAVVCVRALSMTERTATLLAWPSFFIALASGVPMLWLWRTPNGSELALLLVMAATATLGQWAGLRSLRLGSAGLIGTLDYVKLVHAVVLGVLLFGEWPDAPTLFGAGLIVLAAMLVVRG